jgi:hypothetical protein
MAVSNTGDSPLIMSAQGDADTRQFIVTWVRWNGATTAGHTLTLKDSAGNIIFESVADGANFIDMQPIFKPCRGLSLTTMQSGTLYVFYR